MLVRFTSTATESVTMFGDVAVQLIRMLGAGAAMPNAISAEGVSAAAERLRQELPLRAVHGSGREDQEPPVALATRAVPLLEMLKRAGEARVPVMWESV